MYLHRFRDVLKEDDHEIIPGLREHISLDIPNSQITDQILE